MPDATNFTRFIPRCDNMAIKRYSADSEYKKDNNILEDVVLQILDWVHGQPHLPKVEEEDVISFLAACLYSSEVTKQTLDLNYTYKTHIPELFANRDPTNKQTDLFHKSCAYIVPLPGVTEDGYKVLYCMMKPSDSINISLFTVTAELRFLTYVQDHLLYEEGAQKGWRIVMDMCNTPVSVMTKMSPTMSLKGANYLMTASAVRLVGIHLLHPPSYMDVFLHFLKSLIGKQIKDLIKVHNTIEDLYKYIPKTMLPSDIGGGLESVSNLDERYRERIMENREYFIKEEKMRVDESLRLGKTMSEDTLFGVVGSFRKLDID